MMCKPYYLYEHFFLWHSITLVDRMFFFFEIFLHSCQPLCRAKSDTSPTKSLQKRTRRPLPPGHGQ